MTDLIGPKPGPGPKVQTPFQAAGQSVQDAQGRYLFEICTPFTTRGEDLELVTFVVGAMNAALIPAPTPNEYGYFVKEYTGQDNSYWRFDVSGSVQSSHWDGAPWGPSSWTLSHLKQESGISPILYSDLPENLR